MNIFQLDPSKKALIITFPHPFQATEMMAESYALALNSNGFDVVTCVIGEPQFNQKLNTLFDPQLAVVFCLGSLGLEIQANNTNIWKLVSSDVLFVTVVLDSLPYDFRVPGFARFVNELNKNENCFIVSYENNSSRILSLLCNKTCFYIPTAATLMPLLSSPKKFPDRLMFWGSIETELAKSEYTGDVYETLARNNIWNLNSTKLKSLAESLMYTEEGYPFNILEKFLDQPIAEIIKNGFINQLCNIDSSIKRFRRFLLIYSLKDFPIDIYGKNWDPYIDQWKNIRIFKTEPDHNKAFAEVCQHYAGVVNIDPNWGWGTNERAITSLALGIKTLTNKNIRVDGIEWCYQYCFSESSIVNNAMTMLNSESEAYPLTGVTWDYFISKLLRNITHG